MCMRMYVGACVSMFKTWMRVYVGACLCMFKNVDECMWVHACVCSETWMSVCGCMLVYVQKR
jgi:hypothetical protein